MKFENQTSTTDTFSVSCFAELEEQMPLSGRNLVTVLLCVVMAMPALSPPALRHSHADGETSHRHHVAKSQHREGSQARGHKHSHSSRHHHRVAAAVRDSHAEDASLLTKSPVEHFHVFWLGFRRFLSQSLPTSERSDSPPSLANVNQWVPLVPETNLTSSVQDESTLLTADAFLPTELTPQLSACSAPRPPQTPAACLLCDTARHERSGVLVV
jgi:hypothetical protein